MPTKNSTYLILGLVLLILSAIGGYFLFQVYQTNQQTTYTSTTTPKIELLPTDSPQPETESVTPSSATSSTSITTPIASVSGKVTPITTKTTITPTKTPTLIPTKIPTKTPTAVPTMSSSTTEIYSSDKDGFSVEYSAKRKLYQDTESAGNRYTFYLTSGNFAVHVSSTDKWAWTHPDRQFDENSLVAGQPSFRYDIAAQTIVDIQYNDRNYTIQCVHNGNTTLKTECEDFISSFKLL